MIDSGALGRVVSRRCCFGAAGGGGRAGGLLSGGGRPRPGGGAAGRTVLGERRGGAGRAGSSFMMLTGGIEADDGKVYLSGIGARVSPPVGAIMPAAGAGAAAPGARQLAA